MWCVDKLLPAGKLTPSRNLDLKENFHVERVVTGEGRKWSGTEKKGRGRFGEKGREMDGRGAGAK